MNSNETTGEVDSVEADTPTDMVSISREELEYLKARAEMAPMESFGAGIKGEQESIIASPPRQDSGEDSRWMKELAARDARVAELERTCKAAVRDRELATILAGKPLVPGAAAQLIKLWRDEFDIYEEDGLYKIAARDGRKPSQVVGEWLASADYSHFCLPASRGGTGARDASRPVQPLAEPAAVKNLGEAIVMKWREEAASRPAGSLKPIGLRRHR